ncbi:hypothetical protein B0H19DRAFT_1185683 [Mycena capillaripes]|nr:hypothetical protein B0H19DRAFT_1185683 [Mycena capillaripes]
MDPLTNPLYIPELVDECIHYIRHSLSDLIACSLVSRRWARATQPHLYTDVAIGKRESNGWRFWANPGCRWSQLQRTLSTSPHLIRYIRRLDIDADQLSQDAFSAICNFPFTHLEHISVFSASLLSLQSAMAMQQLFSLPTLRHLKIRWHFTDPTNFLQIWKRCSSSIQHLDIHCFHLHSEAAVTPSADHSAPIALRSLRVTCGEAVPVWLAHDPGLFDFSGLKMLSIHHHTGILALPKCGPVVANIEVLDFIAHATSPRINLCPFSSLTILRLAIPRINCLTMALHSLSTIPDANRIQKIIIHATWLDREVCERLDLVLSKLPLYSAVVEFEMEKIGGEITPATLPKYFSRLSARNMLTHVSRQEDWFQAGF